METKTETVQPESIETQVAKWSATDAALLMAVEATRGIAVADHVEGPKKGREAVHRALMDLSSRRTAIESRREELKRPILNMGKLVDSEARRLTAIVEPREKELRADRDAYDAEQKRIKEEADRLEREKIEAEAARVREEALARLNIRVQRVVAVGGTPDLAWLTTAEDADVDGLVARLKSEQEERAAAAERERVEREQAEAIEMQRLKEEAIKREAEEKAQREERTRKDEELRLERERAEALERAERAEKNRLERIEQERIAAKNKAEAERLKQERVELERARAESARLEAERLERENRQREEKEAADRELREREAAAAEAARIAAEAPDREKIALEVETWRNEAPEDPGIESDDLREVFGVFVESIRKQMNEFLSALKENA